MSEQTGGSVDRASRYHRYGIKMMLTAKKKIKLLGWITENEEALPSTTETENFSVLYFFTDDFCSTEL